jgi:hypothetical protein
MKKQEWSVPLLIELDVVDTEGGFNEDPLSVEDENFAYLGS